MRALALCLAIIGALAPLAASSPTPVFRHPPVSFVKRALEDPSHPQIQGDAYFIELTAPPAIEGGNREAIIKQQAVVREKLADAGITYTERAAIQGVYNALSVELRSANDKLARIEKIDGVKAIWPMVSFDRPTVSVHSTRSTETPQLYFSANLTGAAALHERKIRGKGVKVGIIDTGVDYKHEALGGCFGQGCRVAYGYDFVGDNFGSGKNGSKVPVPDDDPMDCGGHGTHVAGIVGANSHNLTGIAPDVILGAYRVFGCNGSTTATEIVHAMDRAWEDGMHIINLSLGGGSSFPGYPTAATADRLAKAGMVVVAAIGNDGESGLFQTSAPSAGNEVISVASFENAYVKAHPANVTFADAMEPLDVPVFFPTAGGPEHIVESELVLAGLEGKNETEGDACYEFPKGYFRNQTAVVRRGWCNFIDKIKNCFAAGASNVLFVNNAPGILVVSVGPAMLPYFSISHEDGTRIVNALLEGKSASIFVGMDEKYFANPANSTISTFSSWGPGYDLNMKPDLGAPGGKIYSTYPLVKGAFATLSGTSMASPTVAGAAALYLERFPDTKPQRLRQVFQNTAVPSKIAFSEAYDSVARQGAGLLQVDAALDATTTVTPSRMVLRESPIIGLTKTQFITVRNDGDKTESYSLTHVPASSVASADPSKPLMSNAHANAIIFPSKFRLRPGQQKRVVIFLTPMNRELRRNEFWIFSGYVRVQPSSGTKAIHVPYVGMKGDYEKKSYIPDIPMLPYLRRQPGNIALGNISETMTANMTTEKTYLVYRLNHPSPRVTVKVIKAATGEEQRGEEAAPAAGDEVVGVADVLLWQGRNRAGGRTITHTYHWKGHVRSPKDFETKVAVPAGRFRLMLEIEKSPGAWWQHIFKSYEYWKSPVIEVTDEAPASVMNADDDEEDE